jgi:hypothetical protein
MRTKCEAGGNEMTLSDTFDSSVYPGETDFSGKTCVIIGQGQTLDANGAGSFFYGSGAGSSLEVRGLILKNGKAQEGGAVYAGYGTNIEIHNSTFQANIASRFCIGGINLGQPCSSDSACPGANCCGEVSGRMINKRFPEVFLQFRAGLFMFMDPM